MKPVSLTAAVSFGLAFLSGCAATPVCPPETGTPQPRILVRSTEAAPPVASATPVVMRIRGKELLVDRVVVGPLCNDHWSGTVYVGCDVQVQPWEELPTFFEGCDLVIAPGSVIYVADHNDTAYYNGCSCHTGETMAP